MLIRLFVKTRYQGARIESVPLAQLKKLAEKSNRTWSFKDGWLILEGC